MRTAGCRPRLIVFSGMDGVGKSTHARTLVADLRRRGHRAVYRRLRFPFAASVPVLLYARVRGWSYQVPARDRALRAHAFGASPLLRHLYPLTLFLDLFVAIWILIRLPMAMGRTVVCDRFVLDTLVDVAASCERDIPRGSALFRLYETLVPPRTSTYLLTSPIDTLRSRRADSSFEPAFAHRLRLYEQMSEEGTAHVVRTEESFEHVHEGILSHLSQEWPSLGTGVPRKPLADSWYATVRAAHLPHILRRGILLLTHWLFQSVESMGPTERALKAGVWILVFAPVYVLLIGFFGLGGGAILAGVLAHSVNFLVNAHIPVVLKHVGRRVGRDRLRIYAKALAARVSEREYLEGAVAVGGLARDELRATSDIDVRIIPRPGFGNALRAGVFVLRERARALHRFFPLDIYVTENPGRLRLLWETEAPQILADERGALAAAFSLSQAR